jgi:hypothetical protein
LRYARSGGSPVPGLADAVGDLAEATWALAAVFDEPDARDDPRRLALRAAARASETMAHHPDLAVTEIAGQARSTAVDLVRASEAAAHDEPELASASTEEMLVEALDTSSSRPRVAATVAASTVPATRRRDRSTLRKLGTVGSSLGPRAQGPRRRWNDESLVDAGLSADRETGLTVRPPSSSRNDETRAVARVPSNRGARI